MIMAASIISGRKPTIPFWLWIAVKPASYGSNYRNMGGTALKFSGAWQPNLIVCRTPILTKCAKDDNWKLYKIKVFFTKDMLLF